MLYVKSIKFKQLLAFTVLAVSLDGCTSYNPATGQQQIDYGTTAGVAGAAMGAAALGVALSNNNDDRYYYGGGAYRGGHNNYNKTNNININNSRNAARYHRNSSMNGRGNGGFNRANAAGAHGGLNRGNVNRGNLKHR